MWSGAVERLVDRLGDDRIGAALLDLTHEVVAHAVRLHPLEHLDRRPVAAEPDLDEVPPSHRTGFDEPAHRRAVAGEDAPVVGRSVGVGIEMDDPDAARPTDLGDGRRARPGDRVIATEDDRDRRWRRPQALLVDDRVGALDPRRHDVRVARIDDAQDLEGLDVELQRIDRRTGRVLRLADGTWPNRAPDRCVTASSNGAPMMATSASRRRSSSGSVTHGSFMNETGPT